MIVGILVSEFLLRYDDLLQFGTVAFMELIGTNKRVNNCRQH